MSIDQPQLLALTFLQAGQPVVELNRKLNQVVFTIQAKFNLPLRNVVKTEYFYVSFYDEDGYLFAQDYFAMKIPLDYEYAEMNSTFKLNLPNRRIDFITIVLAHTSLAPTTKHLATILDESAFFSTQIRIKEAKPYG